MAAMANSTPNEIAGAKFSRALGAAGKSKRRKYGMGKFAASAKRNPNQAQNAQTKVTAATKPASCWGVGLGFAPARMLGTNASPPSKPSAVSIRNRRRMSISVRGEMLRIKKVRAELHVGFDV